MPDPIISPMTSERPLRYVRLLFLSSDCPSCAIVGSKVAPNVVYPPGVKSKAEDMEWFRRECPGTDAVIGSSSSRSGESLREDGGPGEDEELEFRREDDREEDAKEASSRESRRESCGWESSLAILTGLDIFENQDIILDRIMKFPSFLHMLLFMVLLSIRYCSFHALICQ